MKVLHALASIAPLALLFAACGVDPGSSLGSSVSNVTPTVSPPPVESGTLGGELTGLHEGDTAELHVVPYEYEAGPREGRPVVKAVVGNGAWELRLDTSVPPGEYVVGPVADGYVSMPRGVRFTVSEAGVTYRYRNLDFEVLKPEDAVDRVGYPLCPDDDLPAFDPATATATPTPTPGPPVGTPYPPGTAGAGVCSGRHQVVRWNLERGITGTISGLPDGVTGRVWIERLAAKEGECNSRHGPDIEGCLYPSEITGPIAPMPRTVPSDKVATLEVTNGRWGLVDPSLAGARYLVGFEADASHEPVGGYNVTIYDAKYPTVVDGVDFAFVPLEDSGEPTATPDPRLGPASTPTPQEVP